MAFYCLRCNTLRDPRVKIFLRNDSLSLCSRLCNCGAGGIVNVISAHVVVTWENSMSSKSQTQVFCRCSSDPRVVTLNQ